MSKNFIQQLPDHMQRLDPESQQAALSELRLVLFKTFIKSSRQ